MKLTLFAVLLVVATVANAQQQPYQIPNAQSQVVDFFGSSTALYAYAAAVANLPNISTATFKVQYLLSTRCSQLQQFVPSIPQNTTVIFVEGVGIVDVENRADGTRPSTPVGQFMACVQQLTTNMIARTNPNVLILWTDVNPMNIHATNMNGNAGPYTDPRATLASYNAALTDPNTGLVAQFPNNVRMVLLHDLLTDTDGFGMNNLVSWTDPLTPAWPIIFQQSIGVGLYGWIAQGSFQ